jgi:hypothetical protein
MPPRSPGKSERDGTTERNHPMGLKSFFATRSLTGPEPADAPLSQLDMLELMGGPIEDFAAGSRAQVETPKRGA